MQIGHQAMKWPEKPQNTKDILEVHTENNVLIILLYYIDRSILLENTSGTRVAYFPYPH